MLSDPKFIKASVTLHSRAKLGEGVGCKAPSHRPSSHLSFWIISLSQPRDSLDLFEEGKQLTEDILQDLSALQQDNVFEKNPF